MSLFNEVHYIGLFLTTARSILNWVSWLLSAAWLGSTPHQDYFRADKSLPSAFYNVTLSDYT